MGNGFRWMRWENEKDRQLMKKEIYLKAIIDIQGEDEPAHNFAQSTIQALTDIIHTGAQQYPALTVKIVKIEEDDDEEND